MTNQKISCITLSLLATLMVTVCLGQTDSELALPLTGVRGALLDQKAVTPERVAELKAKGYTAILIPLPETATALTRADHAAVTTIRQANLMLGYWIEVARSPVLAEAHPEWMASLQGHQEWRRFFPDAPMADEDSVVKNYPWVPILSEEPFQGQLARVKELLTALPTADLVLLNDLQGSPSACGCGNTLCRWTSDYGKRRTTKPLGDTAAASFVKAVKTSVPKSQVVPVWTTECEKEDGAHEGPCAGVGCFEGICWKSYTAQLDPVTRECPTIGVLLPIREFERELEIYGAPAGWIRHAVNTFVEMPRKHQRNQVEARRLLTILQGWEMTEDEVQTQVAMADDVGVGGYIVAFAKIEQGWQPKIVRWR